MTDALQAGHVKGATAISLRGMCYNILHVRGADRSGATGHCNIYDKTLYRERCANIPIRVCCQQIIPYICICFVFGIIRQVIDR